MSIERRTLLKLLAGAGLGAACARVHAGADSTGAAPLFLAARRRAEQFEAACVDAHGRDRRVLTLPERGHSFAIDRARRRAVVFGRQPGFFALAFALDAPTPPQPLALADGRHYFGHGTFAADGSVLFATENAYEEGRGVIGVYAAGRGDNYRRIGEFASAGIGPHEVVLLPDRRTLCVANGGILTHPDYGKTELNLDTMAPSLAYLDARDGRLLEQVALPPALHQLSIRHLSVDHRGAVWFGCQYSGPAADRPALVGRHRRGAAPQLFDAPAPAQHALRNYIGSVAADVSGRIIATSSPLGGLIVYWDADSGRCLGHTALADGCGVAALAARRFLISDGHGSMIAAGPGADTAAVLAPAADVAWDNHFRRI